MQQFFNNRYVRLAALTIAIGLIFFFLIWFLTSMIEPLKDFPIFLQLALAFLGAGLLVYKFFSQRVA